MSFCPKRKSAKPQDDLLRPEREAYLAPPSQSHERSEQGGGAGLSWTVRYFRFQQLVICTPSSQLPTEQGAEDTSCLALSGEVYCPGGGWRSLRSLRVGALGTSH